MPTISREYLATLCEARNTLCDYCENYDACEKCQVTLLINTAYNECPEIEEDYE